MLTGVGDLGGRSVLDVGSGLGDLLGWLAERQVTVDYTGYDLTPAMVESARRRWPDVPFELRNLLDDPAADSSFDYVVASGLFNLYQTDPLGFLAEMVTAMFDVCRVGVAFNVLSDRASIHEPGEFNARPGDILDLCLGLTPYVTLRHDYLPHDFTAYLFRDAR